MQVKSGRPSGSFIGTTVEVMDDMDGSNDVFHLRYLHICYVHSVVFLADFANCYVHEVILPYWPGGHVGFSSFSYLRLGYVAVTILRSDRHCQPPKYG